MIEDPRQEARAAVLRRVRCDIPPNYATMRLRFGKYRGQTLEQIADRDVLYLHWLREQVQVHKSRRMIRMIGSPRLLLGIASVCEHRRADIEAALEKQEAQRAGRGPDW